VVSDHGEDPDTDWNESLGDLGNRRWLKKGVIQEGRDFGNNCIWDVILVVIDEILQELVGVGQELLLCVLEEPALWINLFHLWLLWLDWFAARLKELTDEFEAEDHNLTWPLDDFHLIEGRYFNLLDGSDSLVESRECCCKLTISFVLDSLDFGGLR